MDTAAAGFGIREAADDIGNKLQGDSNAWQHGNNSASMFPNSARLIQAVGTRNSKDVEDK
jgi:hypothetical protein